LMIEVNLSNLNAPLQSDLSSTTVWPKSWQRAW